MNKIAKALVMTSAIATLAGLTGQAFAGWDKETEELSLAASDVRKFEISAGAGDLLVIGDKHADTISVTAKIKGRDLQPEDYELYLRKHGDRAYLYAHTEGDGNKQTHIDLNVIVPSNTQMRVQDKSGDANISGIDSELSVKDGSGDLHISEITGNVRVQDGSGETRILTVTGDVDVKDGSGDLSIITVTGNIDVDDGSGDIEVNTVTGDLEVSDNSGDLVVYTVNGEVSVDDSSGDIFVDTAERFSLISDGSGDVELKNVKSDRT